MDRRLAHSRFLLGILDEPITDRNGHSVSWDTNKLGGPPNFIHATINYPRCGLCGHDLALVLQVYAPLEGSPFHRTLYVFGCVNRICWSRPESWAVYRSQILDDEEGDAANLRDAPAVVPDGNEWLDSANVWGSEDDDEEEEEEDDDEEDQDMAACDDEAFPTSRGSAVDKSPRGRYSGGGQSVDHRHHHHHRGSPSSSPVKRGVTRVEHGGPVDQHSDEDDSLCNANNRGSPRRRPLDEQGNARDIFDEDDRDADTDALAEKTGRLLHLGAELEAVGGGKRKQRIQPAEGAVGVSRDTDASAEVEPPDEGTVTLESPEAPTAECLQAVFGCPSGAATPDVRPVLDPWFLAVVDEPTAGETEWRRSVLSEHERDLLTVYQRQEGLNINQLYSQSEQTESSSSGEVYEKTAPKHGDRTFYKMRRCLAACPQQLLRYSRHPEAGPIPLSTSKPEDMDPGRCPYCGGKRSFELQIMPTAVGFLKCKPQKEPAIEFGTVVIYTCRESCWREGDGYREERVVVQADPDDQSFAAVRST